MLSRLNFSSQSRSPLRQNNQQIQSPQRKTRNLNYFEGTLLNQKKSASNANLNLRKSPSQTHENQSLVFPSIQNKNNNTNMDNSKVKAVPVENGQFNRGSKLNLDMLGQVTRLSNVIYILGNLSGDLLYFIENQQKMQESTSDYIHKMMANEFLQIQQQRTQKVMNIFQKFVIDTILANQKEKEKEGTKEIGEIIKKEIRTIMSNHEQYVGNQEKNLEKINVFQNKEVILVTDFYEGVRMILDSYNYTYKEMGSYGKTRPTFENYVKSIHQFKSLLAAEEKNQKAYKLIHDLEALLKTQFEKLDNQELIISGLKKENEKLTKLYEQYQQEKKEWSLNKLKYLKDEMDQQEQDQENQTQSKYGLKKRLGDNEINTTHIRSLEEFYINTVTELKQENKRLYQQYSTANKKLQAFSSMQVNKDHENQKNNSSLEQKQQENKRKNKISFNSADKEIQCNFLSDKNPITKRDNVFINILTQPSSYLKFGNPQSKEWIQSVITVIYMDKILSEVNDEADRRPKCSFQNFTAQWFLKKFGNKDIAEILMKDFLITLKKFGKQSERFIMFSDFCELDELLDPDFEGSNINSLGINKVQFRKMYMTTQEPMKIFLKLAYHAKSMDAFESTSQYQPLAPNILVRGNDLITFESVSKLLEQLLTDDNSFDNIDGFQNIDQLYRKFLAQDMGQRSRDGLQVYNDVIEEDEDQFIRFDFLAKCIIDLLMEKRYLQLEAFYIALQQKGNHKYQCGISFDDFKKLVEAKFQDKSARWAELAYKAFVDAVVTDKTPLGAPVLKILPLLINDDCVSENVLKINLNHLLMKAEVHQQQSQAQSNASNLSKIQNNPSQYGGGGTQQGEIKKKTETLMNKNAMIKNKETETQKMQQVYDHIFELGLLEETYKILLPLIMSEKKNESLYRSHQVLKEEFNKLPKDIVKMSKYTAFQDLDKNKQQIKDIIDNAWLQFRKILSIISTSSK